MSEWIKVTDRLPEDFVDVLVYCIDKQGFTYEVGEKYCAIDRYCKWQDGSPSSFRTTAFGYGEVTHWMPLPLPAKDEE